MTLSFNTVSALGLALAPSEIQIDNGLKGTEYVKTLVIINTGDSPMIYSLNSSGDMVTWISYYEMTDLEQQISSIKIDGKDKRTLAVKIRIPDDAANGNYSSSLVAESTPEDVASGSAVKLKMSSLLNVSVIGDEILSGIVKSITISDTEESYPLIINVEFQNNGNVIATPLIEAEIYSKVNPEILIDNIIFAQEGVRLNEKKVIQVSWDTRGQSLGDYTVEITVSLGGKVLQTTNKYFEILPLGTLSRTGQITEIYITGDRSINNPVKINADFINTGRINAQGKFFGEIYNKDKLIDTIQSEESIVPISGTKTFSGYFTPESSGNYVIKGKVVFGGKETDIVEYPFEVKGDKSIPGFEGIYLLMMLLALFAVNRKNKK
jgi:hypothetical protein